MSLSCHARARRGSLGEWIHARGLRRAETWVGFQTFRNTCATMLFGYDQNAKQMRMWLGHHSPAFTLATYVHLLPDDLPDASFLDGLTSRTQGPDASSLAAHQASSL